MASSTLSSLAVGFRHSLGSPCKFSLRRCGKIIAGCPKDINCWNCKEAVKCTEEYFCGQCHTIQPPGQQNLFEYMGLPLSFDVDNDVLKKRFRDLQFKLHPDKFAQASSDEKAISDEHSRSLNEAYKTLSEPLARAKYLLSIIEGDDTTKVDLDPESLMDMMEWNERVADMSLPQLEEEHTLVSAKIKEYLQELSTHFSKQDKLNVRKNITMLSYLYSLRNTIDSRLHS